MLKFLKVNRKLPGREIKICEMSAGSWLDNQRAGFNDLDDEQKRLLRELESELGYRTFLKGLEEETKDMLSTTQVKENYGIKDIQERALAEEIKGLKVNLAGNKTTHFFKKETIENYLLDNPPTDLKS